MQLLDFGALARSAAASIPDYAEQEAKRQMLALQKQGMGLQAQRQEAELAQAQREEEAEARFQGDIDILLTKPQVTAEDYSRVILRNPRFAEKAKGAWATLSSERQQADLTQMSQIYSATANGRPDLAINLLTRRIDADKKQDGEADPHDEAMLEALRSGDPVQVRATERMMGAAVAAVAGAERFGAIYGQLNKGSQMDIRAAEAGANIVGIDPQTGEAKVLYESPYIKGPDGEILVRDGAGSSAPASIDGPPGIVASELASANLPPSVIAGFLGNFDVEGGYGSGRGDGGSAAGIAQWRGERQANFQRVIGKSVTEASHQEQARFVAWEMQNPEAAGMTVAQRDAILAAKTPAQAAGLIDKHYERSSGEHRSRRLAAANQYGAALGGGDGAAPPGYRVLVPGKKEAAPSGFRWTEDGNLEKIPGGPQDKPNEAPPSGYRWGENGALVAIPGGPADKPRTALPRVPAATMSAYIGNNKSVRTIDETLAAIDKNPDALGGWNKITPDFLAQRIDPKGVKARAGIADVGSLLIHDRSGAAVTASETPRLLPFIPKTDDTPTAAKEKLKRLRAELAMMNQDMADAYSNEEGDSQFQRIGRGRAAPAGGVIKVRSLQEARKLAPGTIFEDPRGRRRVR